MRGSAADIEQPAGVPLRRGVCRICLSEGGGELIAPCLCKGTSKWVHRRCLDAWRARGSNPRALTNCCECGFQYRLHQRTEHLASERAMRRRRLTRKLAGQSLLWFVGVQFAISMFACLVRAIDSEEHLVRLFGFHQVEGHEDPGTFADALRYHKLTYYVAGAMTLLAVTGLTASIWLMYARCCRRNGRQAREVEDDLDLSQVCLECMCPTHGNASICEDCCRCCATCCHECRGGCGDIGSRCGECWPSSGGGSSSDDCCDDCAGMCLVLVVIVLGAFIVIGVFAAVVVLVTALQKAGQEVAKIRQLRDMAAEYEVQDLADPADVGDIAPAGPHEQQTMAPESQPAAAAPTEEELQTQARLERELAQMWNGTRSWVAPSPGASLQPRSERSEQELSWMRAQNPVAASDR